MEKPPVSSYQSLTESGKAVATALRQTLQPGQQVTEDQVRAIASSVTGKNYTRNPDSPQKYFMSGLSLDRMMVHVFPGCAALVGENPTQVIYQLPPAESPV
jgi:hypothetical protein